MIRMVCGFHIGLTERLDYLPQPAAASMTEGILLVSSCEA
jgi:hypothetical protein